MSTRPAQPPPAPSPPAAGDLVRFVEPAGRRRSRVGTVERRIARGRDRGALVVRVPGEARRYVLPADRLRPMGPVAPIPGPEPAPGKPLRLFD